MDNLRYTIVALLGLGMAACTDNVTETDNAQEYGASARNIQVSVLTKGMSRTETGEPLATVSISISTRRARRMTIL